MTEIEFTDEQATDEAVLLLVRKLRRLHRDAYVDLMGRLPAGARDALMLADQRAEKLRVDGVTRTYRSIWEIEPE